MTKRFDVISEKEYLALHYQVRKLRGRARYLQCAHADKTCLSYIVWANISHLYLDVDDFMPLCRSHHRRHDDTIEWRSYASAAGRAGALALTDEQRSALGHAGAVAHTSEQQAKAARSANHNRWHVRRGTTSPSCILCIGLST
jgi:hypothetical protein